MADQTVHELLLALEATPPPDESFGDALYERLAPRAVAAGRRDRSWLGRIQIALHTASRPVAWSTPQQLRTAVIFATVLALLLVVAAIIGSRTRDPNRIVLGSEAIYRDPPAFDMTVSYSDGGTRRFRYDGESTLRVDVERGVYRFRPEGTYIVADVARGRVIEWDPVGETNSIEPIPGGMRPIALLDLRWGAALQTSNRLGSSCLDWEYIEESTVTGRATHHVRCIAGRNEEYWVDVVTGFVLRSTDVPTDAADVRLTGEVRSIEIGGAVDGAAFAVGDVVDRSGARMPGGDASFEAGVRVVTNRFAPAFVATPGDGWRSWGTDRDVVGFVRGAGFSGGMDGAAVWVVRLTKVTDVATGRDVALEPGVDAAIAWLRGHPYIETGEVAMTSVGSLPALSMDYRESVPGDFEATCPEADQGPPPTCRRWFPAGSWHFSFEDTPPAAQRVTVLDVDGATILILASADGPGRGAHLAAIDELVDSLEFLD